MPAHQEKPVLGLCRLACAGRTAVDPTTYVFNHGLRSIADAEPAGHTDVHLQEEWDELAGHLDRGTVAEKTRISEEIERAHCRKQKHLGDQRTEAAESKH